MNDEVTLLIIVIDEASMLDLVTFYRLVQKLPSESQIILVGDPYQLPPIGAGLVLHVLCGMAGVPTTELVEVKRMLGLNERVSSVDVSLGPDSDKTLLDTLTDDRPTDPCELLQDDDLSQSIDQWLSELTDKQREVVIRRFGLRGHESSTLEDVGLEIGLTRERVRQIQVEGLKRLREILEKNGLSSESLFQ